MAVDRAPVELRRPAGARARPSRSAMELHFEESPIDEPVEMERRQRPSDPQAPGRLVAVDRKTAGDDVLVEPAADRLGQDGQLVKRLGRLIVHGGTLSHIGVNQRLDVTSVGG